MSNDAGYTSAAEHPDPGWLYQGDPGILDRLMTSTRAFGYLRKLGYTASQADLALSRAMTAGHYDLSRHAVTYSASFGTYLVTERTGA